MKNNEQDLAVAKIIQKTWQGLGFNVTINALSGTRSKTLEKIYDDNFNIAYESGDFDVIAIDTNMLTSDAFASLAMYSTEYSGGGVDMHSKDYDVQINRLGYKNSEYDDLIDRAFKAGSSDERVSLLHEAEQKLLDDMPVMPVFFLQDYYLINNSVLSGERTAKEGYRDMSRLNMKNYMAYKEIILAEEEEKAEETIVE